MTVTTDNRVLGVYTQRLRRSQEKERLGGKPSKFILEKEKV